VRGRTFYRGGALPYVGRINFAFSQTKTFSRSTNSHTMSEGPFFYPSKMGRIMLLGIEEIIGVNRLDVVLDLSSLINSMRYTLLTNPNHAFSFETISFLQNELELVYGLYGGRGIALRTGRACFKYGLEVYGSMSGLIEMVFRLLPLPVGLHVGAMVFANLFNKHTDQIVRAEKVGNKIFWHIERCPLCWGRKAEEPICHLAVGLLEEYLYWLSGGEIFNVEEIACIARGDKACTIMIDQTPFQWPVE
jgi:hypothetical protein